MNFPTAQVMSPEGHLNHYTREIMPPAVDLHFAGDALSVSHGSMNFPADEANFPPGNTFSPPGNMASPPGNMSFPEGKLILPEACGRHSGDRACVTH
jgi:hypothetical protein